MLKRMVNLAGSVVVGTADRARNVLRKISGKPPRSTCVVLAYHAVTQNQRAQFAQQMDVVRNSAKAVPADVVVLPQNGGHHVAITFDDGLENLLENALPELKKRNIPSTLFIVTDVLGGFPSWEYFGGDDPSEQKAMSAEQLQQIPSELVTIGSHTMTHPVLPKVDRQKMREELLGSRAKLEKLVNREIKLFSFPYGAFSDEVIEEARGAGYQRVFTALPGYAFSEPSEFVSNRVGVNPTDWPIEFRLKMEGAYRWLPYAYALKRKIKGLVGAGSQN